MHKMLSFEILIRHYSIIFNVTFGYLHAGKLILFKHMENYVMVEIETIYIINRFYLTIGYIQEAKIYIKSAVLLAVF